MEFNLTTILILVGAVLGGYVFGIIDARVTRAIRKEDKPAEPEVRVVEAPTALSLTFDDQQRPLLKVDNVPLPANPSLLTPEQRKRLVSLVVVMRPWVEAQAAKAPTPTPVAPSPASVRPAAPTPAAPTPQPPPAIRAEKKPEVEPIKPDLMKSVAYVMQNRGKKKEEDEKPLSIVGQIDMILQEMLPLTPYANAGIALQEAPGGGVLVVIGKQQYQGIDAVPDAQIQAVIKAAVAKWEKG